MRIPTVTGVKRRNRPPSESRTGVRGRRLDVRDVDVGYFDPTDFDTPLDARGFVGGVIEPVARARGPSRGLRPGRKGSVPARAAGRRGDSDKSEPDGPAEGGPPEGGVTGMRYGPRKA